MTVLVTGASGFSGSHVLRHLLSTGRPVLANSRRSVPSLEVLAEEHDGLRLLLGDIGALERLSEDVEAVIHIAATSPAPGVTNNAIHHDNTEATKHLIRLSLEAGVERLVFFSSLSVLGAVSNDVVDENTAIDGPDDYGRSKLAGEDCLREASDRMPAVALRLPGILGAGAARHWLAGVLEKARRDDDIPIYNPDAAFNNAVHIGDLCDLIEKILALPMVDFDAVTLGAADAIPVRAVVDTVVSAAESASTVVVEPEPRHSFTVSNTRAVSRYGYAPMAMTPMLKRYVSESLA